MVLIVNTTSDKELSKEFREILEERNTEYEMIEAADMNISPCLGCNFCWLKTPGTCAIKDDYEDILVRAHKADQLWVITNTALDFMDHKGKNIFDRVMPLVTMNLEFRGNQMRHVMRYDKNPDIGLIYLGEVDRDYLNKWNERCALNFGSKPLGAYPFWELKEAAACM